MDYSEKYRDIAERLWANTTHKGPLFNNQFVLVNHSGLSGGENVIYKVAAAIGAPSSYQMPQLDDICHRLSDEWQKQILLALVEMFKYRC